MRTKEPNVALASAEAVPVDTLSIQEIDRRYAQTELHIGQIRALWSGIVQLEETERKTSIGKNLPTLAEPLGRLFALLAPKDGKPSPLAPVFDVLGDQDDGVDPERFEAELLARRLHRAQTEQKVQQSLEELAQHLRDDVLRTGELVVGPGLLAIGLARSVAKGNATYRSMPAPVLDALRDLTKRARRGKVDKGGADAVTPPKGKP